MVAYYYDWSGELSSDGEIEGCSCANDLARKAHLDGLFAGKGVA